jgi:hypothetical protein
MICYFFSGNRYIRVTRQDIWPGSVDPGYPAPLSIWGWGAFGATGIDAALYSGNKCYFFAGTKYIRVTRGGTGPGTVDPGYPAPISNWGWGAFGATGIDAALYSGSKCYFFAGDQYIRVTRGETGAGTVDPGYPAPISNWGWGAFGATGIDAALYSGSKCYFFAGDQYIRVTRGETGAGTVDPGYPAPISNWGWGSFGAGGIDAALFSGMDDPACLYPSSYPTSLPIDRVLQILGSPQRGSVSYYLDTTESMGGGSGRNELNHAQGLARTPKLSDGSIYVFLTYSEISAIGTLSRYRYEGPTDGDRITPTNGALAVAPKEELILVDKEEHPADIVFLQDIDRADAGYIFVTEAYDGNAVSIYSWSRGGNFKQIGLIPFGPFPPDVEELHGPEFVFLDRVEDYYYLGMLYGQIGQLFRAKTEELFPTCTIGEMNVAAFQPVPAYDIVPPANLLPASNMFETPIYSDAAQVKLIRDANDQWFLLGFRGVPDDNTAATDYIDLYPVSFSPFAIGGRISATHVTFPAGDTSFASTGTHYVDALGRVMVSCSYRWAKDDLSGGAGYVTRVDELST